MTLDEEMDKELAKYPNQADVVRKALRLYHGDITTDSIKAIQIRQAKIHNRLIGIENAITRLSDSMHVSVDKHSEWGA